MSIFETFGAVLAFPLVAAGDTVDAVKENKVPQFVTDGIDAVTDIPFGMAADIANVTSKAAHVVLDYIDPAEVK